MQDYAILELLSQVEPFERFQTLIASLEDLPPRGPPAANYVERGWWWWRLRLVLARADPEVGSDGLAQYLAAVAESLQTASPAVEAMADTIAAGLSPEQLASYYEQAARDNSQLGVVTRNAVLGALEKRTPEEQAAVIRRIWPVSSLGFRGRLVYRYLYGVRPRTGAEIELLETWRSELPYYSSAAALIDSYLDALSRGLDPFAPVAGE